MPKIKLGQAPKTFPCKVTFDLVQGGTDTIALEFNYRTRAQYAQLVDTIYPTLKAPKPGSAVPGFDVVAQESEAQAQEVAFILGAVASWDFEEELNAANVAHVVNEFPAASAAIRSAYYAAINEGRAKN